MNRMTRRLPAAILTLTVFVYVAVPGLVRTDRILCISSDGHIAEEPASDPCCGDADCDECGGGCETCTDRPIFETADSVERTAATDVNVEAVAGETIPPALERVVAQVVANRPDPLVDPPRSHLTTVVLRL